LRPVDEPFGHELKAEWLRAERDRGKAGETESSVDKTGCGCPAYASMSLRLRYSYAAQDGLASRFRVSGNAGIKTESTGVIAGEER
jgi:hypothetical protein